MNPIFEPIIGSSFDAIAGQRAGWAGFNRSIEDANIQRANAAEQNQNNWLARVAEMQNVAAQADAQRAWNQSNLERQLALEQRNADKAEQVRQQEVAIGKQQWKDRLLSEDKRTEAMNKGREMALQLQQENAAKEIDTRGSNYAQQYAYNKRLADAASQQVEPLQAQNDETEKRLTELQAMPKKTDEQLAEMAALKARTVDLKPKLTAALKAKNMADGSLARLEGMMASHGYTADEEAGHVTHIDSGKKWNFRDAVKKAAAAAAVPPVAPTAAPVEPAQGFWSRLGAGIGSAVKSIPGALNPLQAGFDSMSEPPAPAVSPLSVPLSAPNAPKRWVWDARSGQAVPAQ